MTRSKDAAVAALQEVIASAPVVDTHEHLRPPESLGPMSLTALFRNSYLTRSLRRPDGSANGLSDDVEIPLDQDRWETVQAVVERVRLTDYYRWLMRGLADLYSLDSPELTRTAWEYLSSELAKRYAEPTWLATAMDRAGIVSVIWDPNWRPGLWSTPDRRILPSFRINSAVAAFHPSSTDSEGNNLIRDWAERFDMEVGSLAGLEDLIERVLDKNVEAGARSLKSAIAYDRTLAVGPAPRAEAARIFGRAPGRVPRDGRLMFGDYIIRFFLEQARSRGLVVQVHTGIARLADSNPMLLEPLLIEYPEVTFDLFHGGYPWIHHVGALAHNHPNVRLNLTWLPQLSTHASVGALKEWLQVVPQVDRLSWGGDCRTIEESYGALLATRHVTAHALGELVDDGYLDLDAAIAAATSLLSGGGARTYRVPSDEPPPLPGPADLRLSSTRDQDGKAL